MSLSVHVNICGIYDSFNFHVLSSRVDVCTRGCRTEQREISGSSMAIYLQKHHSPQFAHTPCLEKR